MLAALASCSWSQRQRPVQSTEDGYRFTIAAIPDTQHYLDYTRQTAEGFALDAADQFLAQMRYISANARSSGGEIAFAIHLGDVWQHQSMAMDDEHEQAGFKAIENPWLSGLVHTHPDKVFGVEIPIAREGFRILADAGLPFGVVPGNHDHDAMWSAEGWPPEPDPGKVQMTAESLGMLHAGGLDNFRSVFGADSEFFKDKHWYISAHDGGSSSAQRFRAGGYTFLHLALDMSPKDDVLAWAAGVIEQNQGLPTIVTTHDYLSARGLREAVPIIDFHKVDPRHNNAEMLWNKFISQQPQIFLVLSGHQHGQGQRVDSNAGGGQVFQLLADYQERGQSGLDAGQPIDQSTRRPSGIGDGWLRLMAFDFSGDSATVAVSTYSTHYEIQSTDLENYASWYRDHEQPDMTDQEFVEADNFTLELSDFYQRFGRPGHR